MSSSNRSKDAFSEEVESFVRISLRNGAWIISRRCRIDVRGKPGESWVRVFNAGMRTSHHFQVSVPVQKVRIANAEALLEALNALPTGRTMPKERYTSTEQF